MGYKQMPCYYERKERFAGETKYPLKKMMKLAKTGLLSFSNKPLMLPIWIGCIFLLISLLYAIIALVLVIIKSGSFVAGWSSIFFIVIFLGGVQLLTVGILGEYIGELFDEAKNRPEYIISEKVNL
jgi:dolichol-phosphate mannosyltransferase